MEKEKAVKLKLGKKKILVLAIIAAAIVVAVVVFALSRHRGSADSGKAYVSQVSSVNAAGANDADAGSVNRYSGKVETQKTQKISLDSSKTIKEIYVKAGDKVSKGDPLFTYDTQGTELKIEQDQLKIEQLNQTISNDNDQVAQLQKDLKSASSSDKAGISAQIQTLQAEIAQSNYDIETTKVEIQRYQSEVNNATVKAKLDGTVESVADISGDSGTTLDSDSSTDSSSGTDSTDRTDSDSTSTDSSASSTDGSSSSSNTLMTIVGTGDLRVKGTVSEQNVGNLTEGMNVIVRSRVDTTKTWTGTLTSISSKPEESTDSSSSMYSDPTGSSEPASKYSFYVTLDNADDLLLGQHVTVEPDEGQEAKRNGIWLDSSYLVQQESGDSTAYVWAVSKAGGKLEKRQVQLGDYDDQLNIYEIKSGLSEDDYIAWPDDSCKEGAPTVADTSTSDTGSTGTDDGGSADGAVTAD